MKDYSYHFDPRPLGDKSFILNRRNSKIFKKILIGVLFLMVLYLGGKWILGMIQTKPVIKSQMTKNPDELLTNIEKITDKMPGTFSVYVYDLKSNQGFGINENMIFTGASVNKIPILASLYHLTSKGEIYLEDTITPQEIDIQDYGTGSIRYDPTGTPYSIRTLARLMMEKSDNTAGHILGKIIISETKIQELIEGWGLTQTDMKNNKTSNADMQILLTKMYKGEITSKELTPEMLGLMVRSDFDDRIPNGLPKVTKVYHKTGDTVARIHDAGIIDLPNRPYYLGIFTTDMKDEKKTKALMAEISKTVYSYFSSL